MSQLGSGAGSSYPTTLDSAEQQTDGASGTLADANWANDISDSIVKIQTELGTDPAGSATNLVTRLARALAASGALNSGTTANRPASPVMGQPYYNTSLDRLEVYDTDLATWNAIAGTTDHGALSGLTDDDHTQYIKADGTRTFTGAVNQEKATPYFQLSGTETSGDKYGIKEDGGFLYISRNTGTVGSPSWTDLVRISTGGVVTLLVDDLVSRDTGNSVNVSMKGHASRHRLDAEDPINLFSYSNPNQYTASNSSYVQVFKTPVYLASGSKTIRFGAYFDSGSVTYRASAKFYISGEPTASAFMIATAGGVDVFYSGSFVATGQGWGTLALDQQSYDGTITSTLKSMFVFSN